MSLPAAFRTVVGALLILVSVGLTSAKADSGYVNLTVYKGGWIIGGSGGSGTLTFRGRT